MPGMEPNPIPGVYVVFDGFFLWAWPREGSQNAAPQKSKFTEKEVRT